MKVHERFWVGEDKGAKGHRGGRGVGVLGVGGLGVLGVYCMIRTEVLSP